MQPRSRQPVSLVVDGALVFADDDRSEVMLEIVAEAAQRMQIILLSYRTSTYRGLEAKPIMLAWAREALGGPPIFSV